MSLYYDTYIEVWEHGTESDRNVTKEKKFVCNIKVIIQWFGQKVYKSYHK